MDKLSENKTTASAETAFHTDRIYMDQNEQIAAEIINFMAGRGVSQWDWISIKDAIDRFLKCQAVMPIADQV